MIKAMAAGPDGKTVLVIGLSWGNLDRFRADPLNTHIRIDGAEMGLPLDIIIMSGRTEAEMGEFMAEFIGPDTTIHVDPRSARDMIGGKEILLAADIERRLRAAGVPSMVIPGIIGAAFMASLTNLPGRRRAVVVHAHLSAVQAIWDDLRRAGQAPDGPMP
jgi:hypothetical protein